MPFSSRTMETTNEEASNHSCKQEKEYSEHQEHPGKVASPPADSQVPLDFPRKWTARVLRWTKLRWIIQEWKDARERLFSLQKWRFL